MASSTNASATRTRRTTMRGATIKTPEQKTAPTTPPPHSHWPTPPTPRCLFSPRWAARSPAVKGNEEKARMSTLPICRLLSSGFESDLTLTFKDGIPDLKVHRMVLAMHSPVFRRMLSRDWGDRNEIKMNDDFTATYWLMHHLYCGLRYLRSWDVALEVLYMADAYCIPTAGRLATEVLMRHLDKSTFWSIFQVAAHLSNERLLSACDQPPRSTSSADRAISDCQCGREASVLTCCLLAGESIAAGNTARRNTPNEGKPPPLWNV